jgi:hypothetical protein
MALFLDLDYKRKIIDNFHNFQYFYDTVRMLYACVLHAFRLYFTVNDLFLIASREDREV